MDENATEVTEVISKYMLHDPIGNMEAEIAEYDPVKLQAAEDSGAVFIAVYNTGKREIVKAADIKEPQPMMNGVTLVQPVYVDNRMQAVCDVFDALDQVIAQQPAAVSLMAADDAETGQTPVETFHQALAVLKTLAFHTDEGGGADGDA